MGANVPGGESETGPRLNHLHANRKNGGHLLLLED
jgi:hypothetical protein